MPLKQMSPLTWLDDVIVYSRFYKDTAAMPLPKRQRRDIFVECLGRKWIERRRRGIVLSMGYVAANAAFEMISDVFYKDAAAMPLQYMSPLLGHLI